MLHFVILVVSPTYTPILCRIMMLSFSECDNVASKGSILSGDVEMSVRKAAREEFESFLDDNPCE
jgi:hypothetical protein